MSGVKGNADKDVCTIYTTTIYTDFGGKFFVPPVGVRKGDFVYDPSTMLYTFWEGRPHKQRGDPHKRFNIVEVPEEVTFFVDDPAKCLEPVARIIPYDENCPTLFSVTLPIDHIFITQFFEKALPLHWFNVTLWLLPLVQKVCKLIVRFTKDSQREINFTENINLGRDCVRFLHKDKGLQYSYLLAEYKKIISATYSIIVITFGVSGRGIPNSVANHGWSRKQVHDNLGIGKHGTFFVTYTGPYKGLVLQKQRIEKKLAERCFYMYVGGADQILSIDTQNNLFWLKIRKSAHPNHWCSWHGQLLELVLTCLPFGFPAYVFLEIVDRLPGYDKWAQILKLDLIRSVYASAARVQSRRGMVVVGAAAQPVVKPNDPWMMAEGKQYNIFSLPRKHLQLAAALTKRKISKPRPVCKRRRVDKDDFSSDSDSDEKYYDSSDEDETDSEDDIDEEDTDIDDDA